MMKKSKQHIRAEKEWIGAKVKCFLRGMDARRNARPVYGKVVTLSDNQVAAKDEGSIEYDATGLLVEIPSLGRNSEYGLWPVWFSDAEKQEFIPCIDCQEFSSSGCLLGELAACHHKL